MALASFQCLLQLRQRRRDRLRKLCVHCERQKLPSHPTSNRHHKLKMPVLTILWLAEAHIGGSCYSCGGATWDGEGAGGGGGGPSQQWETGWLFVLLNWMLFIRTVLSSKPSAGCHRWWHYCFIQAASISLHHNLSKSLGTLVGMLKDIKCIRFRFKDGSLLVATLFVFVLVILMAWCANFCPVAATMDNQHFLLFGGLVVGIKSVDVEVLLLLFLVGMTLNINVAMGVDDLKGCCCFCGCGRSSPLPLRLLLLTWHRMSHMPRMCVDTTVFRWQWWMLCAS